MVLDTLTLSLESRKDWMRNFIDGIGNVMPTNKRHMEILCDSMPAISFANDPRIMKGSRHYQRKYHYIRDVIQDGEIVLKKVHTDENLVDPFTKPMPYNKHFEHVMAIGVCPASSLIKDGLSTIAMKLGTPLMLDSYTSDMCLQSWGGSSYARAMIELRANVELKDTIVVAMPKLTGEEFYTCEVSQESRLGCGEELEEYRPISKKPTANTSGNTKKGVEPKEVSNSNPFDLLNSVENDGELGDHDSEDEVESIDNDMARSMASKRVGFGTKNLLEQWRDSYENGDYDEDPYDDDMYEVTYVSNSVIGFARCNTRAYFEEAQVLR
nr:hypothetical protein [Tanacetum cinerariifolium]